MHCCAPGCTCACSVHVLKSMVSCIIKALRRSYYDTIIMCTNPGGEGTLYERGDCNPNPPPPPPPPPPLVVYTHASLKSGIMETVACEQQSDDQSVYTTDVITYTMPVLYGHNDAVDNTQTPKLYAFNTLEILYTQLSV